VMGLQKGVYGIRLTATDVFGNFSSDTVWVAVDTTVSFASKRPQIKQSSIVANSQLSFSDPGFLFGEAIVTRQLKIKKSRREIAFISRFTNH
jgi:hypothetical protein